MRMTKVGRKSNAQGDHREVNVGETEEEKHGERERKQRR